MEYNYILTVMLTIFPLSFSGQPFGICHNSSLCTYFNLQCYEALVKAEEF